MDVLRHSYGTYRLPILKSADALALEMGNSADVIFRHYRRPVNEATARAYFAIIPNTQSQAAPVDSHSNATLLKSARRRVDIATQDQIAIRHAETRKASG